MKGSFLNHRHVITPRGQRSFQAVVHEVDPDTLMIERDFYEKYGQIPTGEHHEIELVSPAVWNLPQEIRDKIHFKTSSLNGKRFVCYPRPITTTIELNRIFGIWCLGTAWTLDTGRDFQELEGLNGVSVKEAEQFMRANFCICFVWDKSPL